MIKEWEKKPNQQILYKQVLFSLFIKVGVLGAFDALVFVKVFTVKCYLLSDHVYILYIIHLCRWNCYFT